MCGCISNLLSKWIAQFPLSWETGRISWVRVPLEFTVVNVTIAIGIDHAVSRVIRVELEVEFPASSHSIIVMVLIIDFWAIIPAIAVCIVGNWICSILFLFKIGIIFEVVIELLPIWGIRVNVTIGIGRIIVSGTILLDESSTVQAILVRVFFTIHDTIKVTVRH